MSLFCASIQPLMALYNKAPSLSTLYTGESPKGATFKIKKSPIEVLKKVLVHCNLESGRAKSQDNEHAIRSVPVQVANELLRARFRYLDVSIVEEYNAVHVEGSINIPYLVKWGGRMRRNYSFLDEVETRFGKDHEIIVGCKVGVLYTMVATELVTANFTKIITLGGGYVAWEKSGLPIVTNQKLGRRTSCDHSDDKSKGEFFAHKEHVFCEDKEKSRVQV